MDNQYDWRKGRELDARKSIIRTPEELEWWERADEELEKNKDRKVPSLAHISHSVLGRLYAIEGLETTKILEEESIVDIYRPFCDPNKDEYQHLLERWQWKNEFVTEISERILSGEPFSKEYLQEKRSFPRLNYDKTNDDLVWHLLVQGSCFEKLPYIPFIPEEESKQAIRSYLIDELEKTKRGMGLTE